MSYVQVSIARLLVDVMPFLTFMTLMMMAFATALWIIYRPYDGNIKYEFSTIPGVPSSVVCIRYVILYQTYRFSSLKFIKCFSDWYVYLKHAGVRIQSQELARLHTCNVKLNRLPKF